MLPKAIRLTSARQFIAVMAVSARASSLRRTGEAIGLLLRERVDETGADLRCAREQVAALYGVVNVSRIGYRLMAIPSSRQPSFSALARKAGSASVKHALPSA